MRGNTRTLLRSGMLVAFAVAAAGLVFGNGGPFVVKYPSGDPAAKGVLARIGTDLRPTTEERLRVLKEDLNVSFGPNVIRGQTNQPLVRVAAIYTIENPTEKEIEMDFGFPILRGISMNFLSMMPQPEVHARLSKVGEGGGEGLPVQIISNSLIYGIIRSNARQVIENAIGADAELARLVAAVRPARAVQQAALQPQVPVKPVSRGEKAAADVEASKKALAAYATDKLKWYPRDAALLAEYVALDFGKAIEPRDRDHGMMWLRAAMSGAESKKLLNGNLGPLGAIGEQKATQLFAQLAGAFDPKAARAYEDIFAAWGGEVKEQSVDLATGKVRPRELSIGRTHAPGSVWGNDKSDNLGDPTVYARVDYLDEKAPITDAEKAACRTILKNLPVTFTFAPMNLLYYRVKFPAKATRVLTVSYSQYGYKDTATPASYQLAYVVHPASFWKEFGPINLEVTVPGGMPLAASVPLDKVRGGSPAAGAPGQTATPTKGKLAFAKAPAAAAADVYRGELKDKTGEIFLAVPAREWEAFAGQGKGEPATPMGKAVSANVVGKAAGGK